jgi:hypothetical protein
MPVIIPVEQHPYAADEWRVFQYSMFDDGYFTGGLGIVPGSNSITVIRGAAMYQGTWLQIASDTVISVSPVAANTGLSIGIRSTSAGANSQAEVFVLQSLSGNTTPPAITGGLTLATAIHRADGAIVSVLPVAGVVKFRGSLDANSPIDLNSDLRIHSTHPGVILDDTDANNQLRMAAEGSVLYFQRLSKSGAYEDNIFIIDMVTGVAYARYGLRTDGNIQVGNQLTANSAYIATDQTTGRNQYIGGWLTVNGQLQTNGNFVAAGWLSGAGLSVSQSISANSINTNALSINGPLSANSLTANALSINGSANITGRLDVSLIAGSGSSTFAGITVDALAVSSQIVNNVRLARNDGLQELRLNYYYSLIRGGRAGQQAIQVGVAGSAQPLIYANWFVRVDPMPASLSALATPLAVEDTLGNLSSLKAVRIAPTEVASRSAKSANGSSPSPSFHLDAEAVRSVYPELVRSDEDGANYIGYTDFVPLLIDAVNALSARVTELEAKVGS